MQMRRDEIKGECRNATLLAGFCLTVIGCTGPVSDPLGRQAYQTWVSTYGNTPLPPSGPATADFIFGMKSVKDYEYANYVTALRRGTSYGEFGSDAVKIVLDSLISVTGGAATKSALGAASAGVTGATTSIKKNVLFDQSITTFITKMDALRLEKYNDIIQKMQGRGYTQAEAFDDLQDYGRRGTLDAALSDTSAKAGAQKSEAKAVNDNLLSLDAERGSAASAAPRKLRVHRSFPADSVNPQ